MRGSAVRAIAAFGVAGVATLALAACGSSSKSSSSKTTSSSAASTSTTAASATTTTAGSASPTGTATVTSAQTPIGKILVDSKGLTLYVWDNDKTMGTSSCTGACATAWPPLMAPASATYGTGLSAAMFSTITRPDGTKQLAVNGKPLYLWMADTKPGDTKGQGVNGFYVVGVNGQKIDNS
jgi:predicted lipoprotein with Yx(FWY)xxD motif